MLGADVMLNVARQRMFFLHHFFFLVVQTSLHTQLQTQTSRSWNVLSLPWSETHGIFLVCDPNLMEKTEFGYQVEKLRYCYLDVFRMDSGAQKIQEKIHPVIDNINYFLVINGSA